MSRIHWVVRETGTPEDRDEVNKREVCEWSRGRYLLFIADYARVFDGTAPYTDGALCQGGFQNQKEKE